MGPHKRNIRIFSMHASPPNTLLFPKDRLLKLMRNEEHQRLKTQW
jgi:hypothetical protein